MFKIASLSLLLILSLNSLTAQIVFIPGPPLETSSSRETGFLPGKKFPIYNTINSYNFNGLTLRVEVMDKRGRLNLKKVECSYMPIGNYSDLAEPEFMLKFMDYVSTVFKQANIRIDSTSENVLQLKLEAIDCRLIGFGEITAHGLCQMSVVYQGDEKTYCVDMTDKDKHAPIPSNSVITRKTGIRVMGSAAIREVLEQFLTDLKTKE